MPDNSLEDRLRGLPVARFDERAESLMLERVRRIGSVGRSPTRRPSRAIPLWQAAAACVLVGVLVHFGTRAWMAEGARMVRPPTHAERGAGQDVRIAANLFARSTKTEPLDVSRWTVHAANTGESP